MPSKSPWVIGLDLSLTAPAGVALPLNWRPGDWRAVKWWLDHPKAPKNDDRRGQLERYAHIAAWVREVVWATVGVTRGPPGSDLAGCYIEQYAFSRNNSQASRLMELGGIARMKLFGLDVVPATVNTSPARKLLLGKVPRSDQKIAVQRFLFDAGAPKAWEENICDAFVVANYGLSECGGVALATG